MVNSCLRYPVVMLGGFQERRVARAFDRARGHRPAATRRTTGTSKPALFMAWTTTSGTQASSANVSLSVTNARDYAVRYKLTLRGVGLDGREVSVDKGTFTLNANATTTHSVPANQLPVQSKGTDSLAEWVADVLGDGCPLGDAGADATVTSDAGQNCEPTGASAVSMPLYHTFATDYSTVTIRGLRAQTYGSDTNQTTTSGVLALTYPNGPPTLDGRVYDGTTYTSYASLSPLGTADYTWKDMFTLTPAAAQRLSDLGVNQAGAVSGPAFCLTWDTGRFLVDAKGELVTLGASVPAARAQAFVTKANADLTSTPVWEGILDDDGCTRALSLVNGGSYRVTLLTRVALTSDAGDFDVTIGTSTSAPQVHGYERFITVQNVSLATVPVPFRFAEPEARVAAIVSAMMGQGAYVGTRLGVQYRIYADQGCGTSSACASGGGIFIGKNDQQPQTHDAQWKVVVTHEFGHAVQDVTVGLPFDGNYNDDIASGAASLCRCDHVKAATDRQHCLQSREVGGSAQVEAYAHFFASRIWSGADSTSCTFPYYKEVLTSSGLLGLRAPPYPANCAAPVKWMDNNCPTGSGGRGVEWDWLNFFHNIHSSDVTGNLSHSEIMQVYRQACGNKLCSAPVSYAQLKTAADTVFGASSSKAFTFSDAQTTYGVNH